MYISKHLKYVIKNDLYRSDIEIFWCEIRTSSDKFLVGVIYRPPQSCAEYWEKFSATMEQALDTEYKLFLVGDFNVNMLASGNNTLRHILNRKHISGNHVVIYLLDVLENQKVIDKSFIYK